MADEGEPNLATEQYYQSQLHGLGKIDWFLSEMVEMAELGFTPYVLLTVGGSHVAGKLISSRQYFLDTASLFEEANIGNSDLISSLVARFKGHANDVTRAEGDKILGQTRRYIHLADAKFHTPDGHVLPSSGATMRFKMIAVDGFSLGELITKRS